jgi:hypothetical protein
MSDVGNPCIDTECPEPLLPHANRTVDSKIRLATEDDKDNPDILEQY